MSVPDHTKAADDGAEPTVEKVASTATGGPGLSGSHAADETNAALDNERNMTIPQTLRFWRKAVLFSFFLSLCIIMESYDTSLMNNFFAFPAFQDRFGDEPNPAGGKVISARWQTIILNGTQVGCIIGLIVNGYITEWLGYKKTMLVSMTAMIGAIFIPFFSTGLPMFLAGGLVQGIPWGIFQTLAVSYAADLCPTHIRAYMTSWINLCWVTGGLLSTGILRGLLRIPGELGYKVPFAVQWVWPVPIMVVTLLCPESPWWLVRQGRVDEAREAVRKLITPQDDVQFDLDAHVDMMVVTDKYEKQINAGVNYHDLFKGANRRRTEIALMVFITQALCGVPFMGYAVQFMANGGLPVESAYNVNVILSCAQWLACVAAWFVMTRLGRRFLYVWGLLVMVVILLIVGFVGLAPGAGTAENQEAARAVAALIVLMLVCFQLSLGPICYTIVAEIPSTRNRIKTVALARASYNAAVFINNALMPQMVGVNAWNWGPKAGFFWAGVAFVFFLWTYFRLPECKGLTYAELDLLFEHRVRTREFSQARADQLKPALADAATQSEKQ
ncbi:hypothetical protein RB595_006904 [Gaeumannomyces hyphopodioides]